MFQKVQIQTSDTLQVYHGEYRGIFENIEFWAASSALQAKNGQNLGIIWMYSQWLQLLGSFNLIQADANLREINCGHCEHISIWFNTTQKVFCLHGVRGGVLVYLDQYHSKNLLHTWRKRGNSIHPSWQARSTQQNNSVS